MSSSELFNSGETHLASTLDREDPNRLFPESYSMRNILPLVPAVFTALAFIAGCASVSPTTWEPLFDGTSTTKWRGYRKDTFPTKGWEVHDGALHFVAGSGGGDIVTKESFDNFDLEFEWKVSAGANSGVMYRVSEDFEAPWHTGPEYQVLDDTLHPDGKNPRTTAASAYALIARDPACATRPVGEWNQGRIRVKGDQVEHWLNGKKAVEFHLGSPAFADLVKSSKFKDMPRFAREAAGRICLQDHGDSVWYRNIRIRRLAP